MSDPQTPTIGIYQPTRGSDSGTWDLPVNANSGAIDALFGNVITIGLTNSPVTLTMPPNSGASWAGPYQAQSALVRFTGTLTGNCVVTVPRAGFYIMENRCTVSTFYVQLTTGSGNAIGLPPGKKCHVFSDGTDMDFVDMPDVGTKWDIVGQVAMPAWMTACTVLPYLIRDGSVYNNTAFPQLAAYLGNTFGGTPGLTFAVPDSRGRLSASYDPGNTGRINSTVNAGTMGSAGGAQALSSTNQLPQFTPSGTIGGSQTLGGMINGNGRGSPDGFTNVNGNPLSKNDESIFGSNFSFSGTTIGSSSPSQALPPLIVDSLPLIKT